MMEYTVKVNKDGSVVMPIIFLRNGETLTITVSTNDVEILSDVADIAEDIKHSMRGVITGKDIRDMVDSTEGLDYMEVEFEEEEAIDVKTA